MVEINDIIETLLKYHPDTNTTLIKLAYNIATKKHEGQTRVSGTPYLTHALEVANLLAEMRLDVVTIAAGLLHDVVEDADVSIEEIKDNLGSDVSLLVEGVTKISAIQFKSLEQKQAENIRKMFLAMAKDIRVVLIKLADRTHNMRTLEFLKPEKQERIARETIEIYAPLANRLGIGKIKNELEDLCFKYLYPEDYKSLSELVEEKFSSRSQHIEQMKIELEDHLKEQKINASISGRPKHLYGIYHKMKKSNKTLDEIYDLIALRVLTDTVNDCYAILGIIHTKWTPMPGRFKDYIATPKANMYQSLHTTIISPYKEPIEVQIRTNEMHHISEEGIAAHWLYKENGSVDNKYSKNIIWLRQLVEWINELKNPHEFMDALKLDLFKSQVYVFTPRGEVKELPEGSTPVDFAYSVHTDLGHRCIGARINNRIVPLKYNLKNGDIVEVISAEKHHPNKDWLSFVKTTKAISKIRQWIKQQEYDESITSGEKILYNELTKEIKHFKLDVTIDSKLKEISNYLNELGYETREELVSNISYNKVILNQLLDKLFSARREMKDFSRIQEKIKKPNSEIIIEGIEKEEATMIRLARCCTPVPYDDIIGFITRGKGVTIHRIDCSNISTLQQDQQRMLKAHWNKETSSRFNVALKVKAYNRVNLLKDVLSTIADTKIIINSASAKALDNEMAACHFLIEISDINQLQEIINKISKVESVVKVYRMANVT